MSPIQPKDVKGNVPLLTVLRRHCNLVKLALAESDLRSYLSSHAWENPCSIDLYACLLYITRQCHLASPDASFICLSPFKKCLSKNYHSCEMVEMKSLWKLWWPPWVVCSNDYVWNCFGKVNACTLGFFHPSPKKTHQPGQPVCPRPGDQLRTLASWGEAELLPICDLYFSTWTSVEFFLWTSKILGWSLGCLLLLPLRKQSSSFQQLNDCSRPDVLSSTPHSWWFDGRLHFLSRCADFSGPHEKTSPLYWRKERLGRVQRTQSAALGKRPAWLADRVLNSPGPWMDGFSQG